MGLFLIAWLFAGCMLGLLFTTVAGTLGLLRTVKSGRTRRHVWLCLALVSSIILILGIVAVHQYPYAPVRPGSDYDVAMRNFFLQGFGYCLTPGPAILLGGLATVLMPRKAASTPTSSKQVTRAHQG